MITTLITKVLPILGSSCLLYDGIMRKEPAIVIQQRKNDKHRIDVYLISTGLISSPLRINDCYTSNLDKITKSGNWRFALIGAGTRSSLLCSETKGDPIFSFVPDGFTFYETDSLSQFEKDLQKEGMNVVTTVHFKNHWGFNQVRRLYWKQPLNRQEDNHHIPAV